MFKTEKNISIDSEKLYEAIKDGVKEAIHEMMESGNGYNGPILREHILGMISDAIKDGVSGSFPCYADMEAAIQNGCCLAFPHESKIIKAIENGVSR